MKDTRPLKLTILLFWAAWLLIVLATNICDVLKTLGILEDSWSFASGNYEFMRGVTGKHGTPAVVNTLFFAGVITWEALATVLHWRAAIRFRAGDRSGIVPAFTVSIALWAAFLLADEFFIAYAVEATHFRLFVAGLVSVMAVMLLPDERTAP